MSKELEALEKLNHTICLNSPVIKWGVDTYDHIDCASEEEFSECYQVIEKALERYDDQCEKQAKILDILKKKEVDIGWLENCKSLYNFNSITDYQLTQEEYDLLKEWLNGTK